MIPFRYSVQHKHGAVTKQYLIAFGRQIFRLDRALKSVKKRIVTFKYTKILAFDERAAHFENRNAYTRLKEELGSMLFKILEVYNNCHVGFCDGQGRFSRIAISVNEGEGMKIPASWTSFHLYLSN